MFKYNFKYAVYPLFHVSGSVSVSALRINNVGAILVVRISIRIFVRKQRAYRIAQ